MKTTIQNIAGYVLGGVMFVVFLPMQDISHLFQKLKYFYWKIVNRVMC